MSQTQTYKMKTYEIRLKLEEPYMEMLKQLKKWKPNMSKQDIIKVAIQKLYFAYKAYLEGRDPCEEFLTM